MKLHLDRDRFAEAVAWATKSLPTKPTVPVLAGLLLQVRTDSGAPVLSITGSSLNATSRSEMNVEADGECLVCIPGRLLADIVSRLPDSSVTLCDSDGPLVLTSGPAIFQLPTLEALLHPCAIAVAEKQPAVHAHVGGAALAQAVNQVAFAASKDPTVAALNGVLALGSTDTLTLVATDRYRLAVCQVPWVSPQQADTTALITASTLVDAARGFAHSGGDVDVLLAEPGADSSVTFAVGGKVLTTSLLAGEFPQWARLIPDTYTAQVSLDSAVLSEVVSRARLVLDSERSSLIVNLGPACCTIKAGAGAGSSAKYQESFEIDFDGPEFDIGFNAKFLSEGLTALGGGTITLGITSATKAVVFTGENAPGLRYLLMPVRDTV